jgi:hypothetical protein
MDILAFNPDTRRAFRREIDREASEGLREIVGSTHRYLSAVPAAPADPFAEIERLRSALLDQYWEVELLLSDLSEMRAIESARSRR